MNSTGNSMPGALPEAKRDTSSWKEIVRRYQKPSLWRAVWQLTNTVIPYVFLWYLMYRSLVWSHWITFGLAALAGLFLVRIFIFFHDCGHGSFFKSRLANDIVGYITGALVLTPYFHWRWEHSVHHANSGDLDRRGVGDLWTMTVDEYLKSPLWRRVAYRLSRTPFSLFLLSPIILMVFWQRIPAFKASPRERRSVHWMNFTVLCMAVALSWIFGFANYALIQLTIIVVGGGAGVWLFYVQHQFEDVYWERGGNWDFTAAALEGSSFYKLPKVLQWFSGNIGFHHIHHLSSRIPNYNLQRCHDAAPLFQEVKALTLRSSLRSLRVHLWDEQGGRLVGFRHARRIRKQRQRAQR
ncbi:MAG: fatty acid desaturase [Chthoniobacter sp.]|uniref:fatty acid desaturase n=1 Tax=Chthoniobacter sp. TaxID=2510640 RepID=UPI0032A4F1CD